MSDVVIRDTQIVVVADQTTTTLVDQTPAYVIVKEEPTRLYVAETDSRVIVQTPGPRGPSGLSGSETASVRLQRIAGSILSGHRIVRPDTDGSVVYASSDEMLSGPWWMTLGAVVQGDSVSVIAFGEVEEPSWSWIPGSQIFLGNNGFLTSIVSTDPGTQIVQVAVAVSSTKLFFDPQVPIRIV